VIRKLDADVIVLGAGPAGLAAACAAIEAGASVVVVEREERVGGILKQCVHDGFGLVRYRQKLTGPEYALRDAGRCIASGANVMLEAFVSKASRTESGFRLTCIDRTGVTDLTGKSLILATGCRERTDRQVFVHGDRPAGIFTAGLAQYMINVQGLLPGKRAMILGSGDIGLIMARRMTLEGMEVIGAHEIKTEPSGLSRNIRQCLVDYGIPLTLSSTVLAVHGKRRVEGVTVASVDASMQAIPGTGRDIACDTLILSVGLIPENELALTLGVPLDAVTRGPKVDQSMHTLVDGIFACGNAVHVNDLADHVSESGETAGRAAAEHALRCGSPSIESAYKKTARHLIPVRAGPGLLYAVPQFFDPARLSGPASDAHGKRGNEDSFFYFRSRSTLSEGARLRVTAASDGTSNCSRTNLYEHSYLALRPPEMERFSVDGHAILEATGTGDGAALYIDIETGSVA